MKAEREFLNPKKQIEGFGRRGGWGDGVINWVIGIKEDTGYNEYSVLCKCWNL